MFENVSCKMTEWVEHKDDKMIWNCGLNNNSIRLIVSLKILRIVQTWLYNIGDMTLCLGFRYFWLFL